MVRLAEQCAARELEPRTPALRLARCSRPLPVPTAVYQDDKAKKLDGVKSLIKWATMCQYMLVPTEEKEIEAACPDGLPGYGPRGWW